MASKKMIGLIKTLAGALRPFAQMSSRPRSKVNTMAFSKAIQEAQAVYDEVKNLPILK